MTEIITISFALSIGYVAGLLSSPAFAIALKMMFDD